MFYWDKVNRQVRVEGDVEFLAEDEATLYFQSRPKISQIAAAISDQSKLIDSRAELIKRYKKLDEKYATDSCLPRPDAWGGIKVIPRKFEFWQGQSSRIHDRILFSRQPPVDPKSDEMKMVSSVEDGWFMYRLQP